MAIPPTMAEPLLSQEMLTKRWHYWLIFGLGVPLALAGVLFLALLAWADSYPDFGGCDPIKQPTVSDISTYPGAEWAAGRVCSGFMAGWSEHLYVTSDEHSDVSTFYREELSRYASTHGGTVRQNDPGSFQVVQNDNGMYSGLKLTIHDTPPTGWKISDEFKKNGRTYIVVKTFGGFS